METDAQRTLFNKYAEKVVGGAVCPLKWQGYYSYTVESEDGRTVIQFRSDQSPLDDEIVKLAKRVHPNLVPAMECLEFSMTVRSQFYIQAWESSQTPDEEQVVRVRQGFEMKLGQLEENSSPWLLAHVTHARQALYDILQLPWVLTHDDLSSMNLLLDAGTGNLRGVVDWADAAVRPFGIALWGLESVLVEKARKLGLLLRYGFIWQDNRYLVDFLRTISRIREDDLSLGYAKRYLSLETQPRCIASLGTIRPETSLSHVSLPLYTSSKLRKTLNTYSKETKNNELSTYGHSQLKTGHPVRSAIHKQLNGRLVLRWVTTWESLLL
ncbi:hypothetical protein KCU81_g9958, partial [Aureobasidium melanogenum]